MSLLNIANMIVGGIITYVAGCWSTSVGTAMYKTSEYVFNCFNAWLDERKEAKKGKEVA